MTNAAREKARIDRGADGDKAPGFDPGAAPLGTDEEAAGAHHIGPPSHRSRIEPPPGQTANGRDSIAPEADPSEPAATGWLVMVGALFAAGFALLACVIYRI
jgi:hypothetical protein